MISKDLLDLLACPACGVELELQGREVVCTECGRRFPIREGIPVLLVEEAEEPPELRARLDAEARALAEAQAKGNTV